ncbi:hypothetical protein H5410_030980 [Solanum commersonii]|uniref:Uncharacterized protein n=1 Tax=Solanum commersonii TaxID=4109 RepID=A0A9J5YH40_SOLCO|nr:hypothetical protein H5410_030980 [Solanum commersonii]
MLFQSFLDNETLVTILRVLSLPRDLKDFILKSVIEQMIFRMIMENITSNKTKCFMCRMVPSWVTKGRGRGNNPHGRGRSSPGSSSKSSYESSFNSPILQRGGMSLINLNSKITQSVVSSLVHLEDIPENSLLYAQLREYLSEKQSDTFACIAKEDIDDIKSFEKVSKKEMIFLLENSEIQRKEEPWKIFQRYLINGYNTSENVYNFSKMIIKYIISIEDWGISTIKERHNSLNKVPMNLTYWDYINAFDKVLYYNNERHKHTLFIKICAKMFAESIPNWFLNWWSYHGPTTEILADPFFELYKEWVNVSPDLNESQDKVSIRTRNAGNNKSKNVNEENTLAKLVNLDPRLEFCKKEIDSLLPKGLTKPSKLPWSCMAFYVNNATERERAVPRFQKDHKSPWTYKHTTLDNLYNQKFLIKPDAQSVKYMFDKDFKHDASKLIFAVTKGRGRGNNPRGRGRSSPGLSSVSSYRSSSNSLILQRGGMSLINLNPKMTQSVASSLVHLKDIPKKNSPLYAQLWEYLSQKQSDTFASIAKEDIDDIKSFEKVSKREIIFLLENFEIQSKEEPWKIFQRYLINELYFLGESYKTRSYYETILINIDSVEFQHFSRYNTRENFTYWDYINAFEKELYYNNERHKHTWFIKICAKIFAKSIPNWFLNWWSYNGPMTKIFPDPFLKLYKEWVKVSPDLNELYHADHICCIEQIYFFIEFSIPWIHKWTPEVGFTEEKIPCLYRTFYNNFWDKLMKKDPKTKSLYGQELLDLMTTKIQEYCISPHKGIIVDSLVRHIARKISIQDGNKEEMINNYLDETSDDVGKDIPEAQPAESQKPTSEDMLKKTEDFLRELKKIDKL